MEKNAAPIGMDKSAPPIPAPNTVTEDAVRQCVRGLIRHELNEPIDGVYRLPDFDQDGQFDAGSSLPV